MTGEIPWRKHALEASVLLIVVLVFQQVARGEITISVALTVAVGYVLISELIRRRV